MATRYFNPTVSADVSFVGERTWSGDAINRTWNLFNYNADNRATWGLDSQGWLQYRSTFSTYAGRYSTSDLTLTDTFFETDLQPSGSGKYEVGFFMRFIDRFSFYYMTFQGGYQNWNGRNIRLIKVAGPVHTVVADYVTPVFVNAQTYRFRVVLTGNNIKITRDGVEIINYTDNSGTPYLRGAFGPFVLGQEFAKWNGLQAMNNSPFSVSKTFQNESVTNAAYNPQTAKMFSSQSVSQLLQGEVERYLQNLTWQSWSWNSFRVASNDSRVLMVFDRIEGRNVTTDMNARIYEYQALPTSPPLAPTNLQGVALSTSSLRLSWSHADDSEDGFRIYDNNGVLIATLGEDTLTYTETGLAEGTTYRRRVVAFNAAGESVSSSTVSILTLVSMPLAPTNFQGLATGDRSIRWFWEDNATNEAFYELVTWNSSGQLVVLVPNIPAGSSSWDESGLTPSSNYVRAVRAKNAAGTSAASNPWEARTQDQLPSPPSYAPVNFYGIGVSDKTIFWYWLDSNTNEDGFELLDKNDNVIVRIPANQQQYTETELYSLNIYERRIRAYNAGGVGPSTPLASAMTLSDGVDQTGKPLPPYDLRAYVMNTTDVKFTWQYEGSEHFPAVGFKLYMVDGSFMQAIPVEVRLHEVVGLLPNTSYHVYLVAYNDAGDSLKTNEVEFTMPHIIVDPPDPIDGSTLEDPFYGIEYDRESMEMPKLQAFQSGIGDRLDLVVRNKRTQAEDVEVFQYEVYLTGEYNASSEAGTVTNKWESARIVGKSKEVAVGSTLSFVEKIASPRFEIPWQEINERSEIKNYKLVITSTNPNVDVILEQEVTDFFPEDAVFVDIPLRAQIINETQTAWYPSIHNGYYYLNQQEWFLYVDDRVRPKDGDIDEKYVLRFPYVVRASGSRYFDATEFNYIDTEKSDFLQGDVGEGINLDRYTGSITLTDDALTAIYTSRMFRFGRQVTNWYNIILEQNLDTINDGAKVHLSVGASDEYGRVLTWYPQTPGTPITMPVRADKIRYRLTLEAGQKKQVLSPTYSYDGTELSKGYLDRTMVVGNAILVSEPGRNMEGVYITNPLHLGDRIDSLGTIRFYADIPGNCKVKIYTVTSPNPNHDFKFPTTQSPWIPVDFIYVESQHEYIVPVKSAIYPWIAIVIQLTVGSAAGSNVGLTVSSFEAIRASNMRTLGDRIRLNNATSEGTYTSDAYNFPNIAGWTDIITDPVASLGPNIIFETVSADTLTELNALSQSGSAWVAASGGKVQSPVKPWIRYRLRMIPLPTSTRTDVIGFESNYDSMMEMMYYSDNITISQGGLMNVTNPTRPGNYISKAVNVSQLQTIRLPYIEATRPGLVKYYISRQIGGVWTPETLVPQTTNGTHMSWTLAGGDAEYVRFRLELTPDSTVTAGSYTLRSDNFGGGYADNTLVAGSSVSVGVRLASATSISSYGTYEKTVVIENATSLGRLNLRWNNRNPYWVAGYLSEQWASSEVTVTVNGLSFHRSFTDHNGTAGEDDYIDLSNVWVSGLTTITIRVALRAGDMYFKDRNNGNTGPKTYYTPSMSFYSITYSSVTSNPIHLRRIGFTANIRTDASPVLSMISFGTLSATTPRVYDISLRPKLYEWLRIIPRVDEVRLGGFIEAGLGLETHIVPMLGELIVDQNEHRLTEKVAQDIVYDYLTGRNITFEETFVFTDYTVEVSDAYPVELRLEQSGLDYVYGKATDNAGELLYQEIRIYFGRENMEAILKPIPQNGNPICIKNAAGQLLRQVHFRDDFGRPSLTNLEEPVVEHRRYLFLQHTDIDPATLEVYIETNEIFTEIADCEVIADRVVLPANFPSGSRSKVKYRLRNTFVVDYNYDTREDYCLIRVHTPFDPSNQETRRLDIKYEVNKESAYYVAKEIDLNPLRTTINSGFLYLADTVYPPFSLDVQMNPNTLYRGKDDRVVINAIIKDEFGNPVVGERADFTATVGSVQVIQRTSDQNGRVTAIYSLPGATTANKATVTVHVVSRDVSRQITKTVEIFFLDSQTTNKIAILPEKHIVKLGDVVELKVKVMGANNEPLAGRNVNLYTEQGSIDPSIGMTDENGLLTATYTYVENDRRSLIVFGNEYITEPVDELDFDMRFEFVNRYLESDRTDGFVYIEAETYDDVYKTIREQILLGTGGV